MNKREIERETTIRQFLQEYEKVRLINSGIDMLKIDNLITQLSNDLNKLPSRFWPEDLVQLVFPGKPPLTGCEVTKVHFDAGKVTYDIEVSGFIEDESKEAEKMWYTRLHNIDSAFVTEV